MDMQSFIDWMCTNIYIANTDTKPLGGNVLTWQTLTPENDAEDFRRQFVLTFLDMANESFPLGARKNASGKS